MYAEKIVTLVIHEPWWSSSAHQAQLGLLNEIKIKLIFQNPQVYEDQKEKENWFKQKNIFENILTLPPVSYWSSLNGFKAYVM